MDAVTRTVEGGLMKTLDEVIEAQERCGTYPNCHFCFLHAGSMCEWIRDALHYLREYQRYQNTPSRIGHMAMVDLEDNPALTWDELQQMEGKPVWVELTYPEGSYSHWGIIHGFPMAGYEWMEMRGFHEIQAFSVIKKEQGKTWQAYRKERE